MKFRGFAFGIFVVVSALSVGASAQQSLQGLMRSTIGFRIYNVDLTSVGDFSLWHFSVVENPEKVNQVCKAHDPLLVKNLTDAGYQIVATKGKAQALPDQKHIEINCVFKLNANVLQVEGIIEEPKAGLFGAVAGNLEIPDETKMVKVCQSIESPILDNSFFHAGAKVVKVSPIYFRAGDTKLGVSGVGCEFFAIPLQKVTPSPADDPETQSPRSAPSRRMPKLLSVSL